MGRIRNNKDGDPPGRRGHHIHHNSSSSSSSLSKQQTHDSATAKHIIDDEEDTSIAGQHSMAASSFAVSYIKSIMDRRSRYRYNIKPKSLIIMSNKEDAEDEDDNGGRRRLQVASSNNTIRMSKRKGNKRTNRSSSSSKLQRKTFGFLILIIIGLASNWVATRILNRIYLVGRHDDDDLNEQQIKNNDIHHFNYLHRDNNIKEEEPAAAVNNQTPTTTTIIVDTKRFIHFRQRLLSLYSEPIPTTAQLEITINSTTFHNLHPLYNILSPQYKALDWIANIDQIQLKHDHPGLIQRYVLAVLYYSTGGPPTKYTTKDATDSSFTQRQNNKGAWRNPTNFMAPTHECEWKMSQSSASIGGGGIRRCDTNYTVNEVILHNELSGSIPSEIGRLWNLQTLYLGRNKLRGTIPTELGMLTKLSSLSLQHNDLSGTLPQSYLKNLRSLKALQVEGNERLSGKVEWNSLLCQMRNTCKCKMKCCYYYLHNFFMLVLIIYTHIFNILAFATNHIDQGDPSENIEEEKYTGKRVLRIFTATCVPPSSYSSKHNNNELVISNNNLRLLLECACCTECHGLTPTDLIYDVNDAIV